MKASRSDFYTLAPTAPVAVNFLPPDFKAVYIDFYQQQALDPLIAECEACDARRCHALIRTRGDTLKPDCAAFLALDAAPAAPAPRRNLSGQDAICAAILTALRGGARDIYELETQARLSYSVLRKYLAVLLASGEIAQVGYRRTGDNPFAQRKLYALADPAPSAPARLYPSRGPRACEQSKALRQTNQARLLALLETHGALDAADLARETGLHNSTVNNNLLRLCEAGHVTRAARPNNAGYLYRLAMEDAS